MALIAVLRAAGLLCTAMLLASSAARAGEPYRSTPDMIAAVLPSFVNINARGVAPADPAAKAGEAASVPIVKDEVGSGVIVDPNGLILTNRHVIDDAYALYVTLSDGRHLPARLVAKALSFDIALIQVDAGRPLQPATLGDSDHLRLGDPVIAIGNPWGFAGSVSSGIVSAFHRSVGLSVYDDLIQTDASINQGNSGGPLFNTAGEVVGINEAIYTHSDGGSIGIAFSIPVNAAKFVLDDFRKFGEPRIGWLGITGETFTAGMATALGRGESGGVILSAIDPDSPAATAGLVIGDVILAGDGGRIDSTSALNIFVARSPDRTVVLTVWRNRKSIDIPVALRRSPRELWSKVMPAPPTLHGLGDLGAVLADVPGASGPVVTSIVQGSLSWRAGFRVGDIVRQSNGMALRSVADADALFAKQHELRTVSALCFVEGPNGPRWLDLSLGE